MVTGMDLDTQIALGTIVNIFIGLAGLAISCLLLYVVIRMGVFHGLRAHTRWIDNGKDYERVR